MSLYEKWTQEAYKDGQIIKKTWDVYLPLEQKIYEKMLSEKDSAIKGTVSELAEQHGMPAEYVIGFLEGIKEAVKPKSGKPPYNPEKLKEDSKIDATVDFETLYKKMVEFKAEHLYSLPEWNNIFDAETQRNLYYEQKKSGTFVRESGKIGRNEPCPCGSGKKYKKCCAE